jgi:DNA-binding CsgD family transcriptional regulator
MAMTLAEPAAHAIGRPTDVGLERDPKVRCVHEPANEPLEPRPRSPAGRAEREPGSFGLRLSRVLLGRDDLLELARRRLAEARAGDGRLLLLAGEAGIGKTRLVGAIEAQAAAAGFRTLRGLTSPEDVAVAAAPFLDLARTMSRTEPVAEVGAEIASRLLHIESGLQGDGRRRRRLLVLDVVDLLTSIASAPTFVALENLTYADDLSLEILAGLAHRLRGLPMLVTATYRSDELYPRVPMREWRARLLNERLAEEVRLRRLSLEETASMASQILGLDGPAPSEVVAAIFERTNGIPLHVEELLGVLLEIGRPGRDAIRAADVPDTLQEAVQQRVRGLSRLARDLVTAASVIGHPFDPALLAAIARQPVNRVWTGLDELLSRFFLVATDVPGTYDFRHALIREAIYTQLSVPARAALHDRVANLLAGREDVSDAVLSQHFEQAGRRDEAYRTALAGADLAAAISSNREAFELYRRALRNLPGDLPTLDHARTLREFAASAAAIDDNVTASEAFSSARDHYLASGAVGQAAALLGPLVAVRHLLGDSLESRAAVLRRGLEELDGAPDDPDLRRIRGRLLANLGATYMYDLRVDVSLSHAREGQQLAVAAEDEPTELHALVTIAHDLVFSGRTAEGWDLFESSVRRAQAAHLEVEAARGYRLLGSDASEVIDYERAERWFREGIEYAERVERWNDRHYMAAHLGLVLWATGRWTEALEVTERALADGRGGVTTRITALYVMGYVAMGRGEWERATLLLGESLQLGRPMGELLRTSLSLWGLAETALLAGEASLAADRCEQGRTASRPVGDAALLFPFLVTGTRAHLASGDPAGAARWVDLIEPELRRRSIPAILPAIDHARGLLHLAGGSASRARESFEAAMRGWDASSRLWEGTWVRLDLAAALLRVNRPAQAMSLVEEARSIADRLGSQPLAARASTLLREARARHPTDEPWRPLTAREFEVAQRIAVGQTNAEIAADLFISPKTASSHVEHILAKLGASRRSEIAAWVSTVTRPD